ncbi:MAG: ribonuclease P protein component [Bacteroidales bacterium]|nr:ribonuclease P protein component [Bacteroidales bacterium]
MHFYKKTLGKEERLKSKKLIDDLFRDGQILNNSPFRILYKVCDNNSDFEFPAKIAVSVSKKKFKRAVDRNRIKRKMREAYRNNKTDLYNFLDQKGKRLYFFVIYMDKNDLDYTDIEKKMKNSVKKLITQLS